MRKTIKIFIIFVFSIFISVNTYKNIHALTKAQINELKGQYLGNKADLDYLIPDDENNLTLEEKDNKLRMNILKNNLNKVIFIGDPNNKEKKEVFDYSINSLLAIAKTKKSLLNGEYNLNNSEYKNLEKNLNHCSSITYFACTSTQINEAKQITDNKLNNKKM